MRDGTPRIKSVTRALAMLDTVIADGGCSGVAALARKVGMPLATAHRQVTTLVSEGYLTPSGKGRHQAGSRLLGLLHRLNEKQVVANVAASALHELATRVRSVVQLGTLENDMVTYRIKSGRGAGDLFTRVGMQMEAYCSGIGKALLAHLPDTERDAYLAAGPFVALTDRTITDPAILRQEMEGIREQGYALDDGEIADGLRCLAVPIHKGDGSVLAAISVSQSDRSRTRIADAELLVMLRACARRIEMETFGK
ncbi:IclR family transcriptional regulator [Sphingorhabdus sp. YGSMI21]|nr:IclR family transcriptional regulator [Sphingorhabdus sp. YGSMI21]